MGKNLSVIEQARLARQIAYTTDRIARLEKILQGQPIGIVRLANAIITNAKIQTLSADKLTTGSVSVGTEIKVSDGSNYIIYIDDEVFKIAKTGFDAETADPEDLIFDSTIPCLKFIEVGIREFTINSSTTTTYEETITKSFPIMPFVFLYQPTLEMYKPAISTVNGNYFGDFLHIDYEFDASKLYVTVSNFTGGNLSTHYYYFIGYA